MEGFIKLHRKLLDSELWVNHNAMRVFTWCLLRANYKARSVSVITGIGQTTVKLISGQFITGRNSGAEETQMAPSTFRNSLKFLNELKIISLKPNSHYTIVTICNWDTYQTFNTATGQAGVQAVRQAVRQALDTDKKDKNEKKDTTVDFEDFWNKYHKLTGKPKRDKEPALKIWKKMSNSDRVKALEKISEYSRTNELTYLKMAKNYLSNKAFNDELRPMKSKNLLPNGLCQ